MMTCPKCNKHECEEDTEKDITAYLCLGCGYRTRSDFHAKNLQFQPTIIQMSETFKKMVWKDSKTGLYWFPIEFDIPSVGILYPHGTEDSMSWVYMPMIDLTDDEKRRNPGKKERPDDVRKKVFTSANIKEALKLLKII